MRILLIHQYFLEEDDPGGSRFNEMVKTWTEKGHEVTVLAGMVHYSGSAKREEYKGKWVKKKQQGEVKVYRCHVSESYNKSFLGRLWAYFSFVFSSIWAGLFKATDTYDFILVTSPPLFVGITAYVLSGFKRIPFVFEVRDLWPESAIDTGVVTNKWIIKFAYWFEAFVYKKAKLINVLTPAFREKLVKEKRVAEEKIIFIPNAADFSISDSIVSSFDPNQFRKEQGLNGQFVITYVGAHGVANYLDQLIDTAELLKDEKVLFQLIGSGMEKSRLIEITKKRKLTNVKFINPVPKAEVFKYILASDMGASVLKKVDTFKTIYSNKTFDYMSCKKPVLLAIDGVSRELVNQADCGYYVEPENPKVIAEQVLKCMDEKKTLVTKGNNGYHFAKEHFDRVKLANKYLDLVEKVL